MAPPGEVHPPLHQLAHQPAGKASTLDHSGLGTKHLSWGLLPAHLLPLPGAVDHCAGCPRSWQNAVKLFSLCSTPDSLQLFSCTSEGAQACWAGLISSASHLYISQKQHFCAIPLYVPPVRAMAAHLSLFSILGLQ